MWSCDKKGSLEMLIFVLCDIQGKLYSIMEICRLFDQIYKEHLDGVYVFYFHYLLDHPFLASF